MTISVQLLLIIVAAQAFAIGYWAANFVQRLRVSSAEIARHNRRVRARFLNGVPWSNHDGVAAKPSQPN